MITTKLALAALCGTALSALASTPAAAQHTPSTDSALQRAEPFALRVAAKRTGKEMAAVVNRTAVTSPLSGTEVLAYKVMSLDNNIYEVLLDTAGNMLDSDLLVTEEAAARNLSGKVHPDLADALQRTPPGQRIPVLIWCKVPDDVPSARRPKPGKPIDPALEADTEQAVNAMQEMRIERHTKPVADHLKGMGFEAEARADAPIVAALLDAAMISAIAALPEVLDIYLDSVNSPDMAVVRQVVRANVVNSRGITGSGVRVGLVEVGGRFNTSNPYRPSGVQNLTCSCMHDHTAAVLGVLASWNNPNRGIAYGGEFWIGGSCSGYESELQSRMGDARNWGARVFNLSWGYDNTTQVPNAMARFIDNQVISYWRTYVGSAGNRGEQTIPNVTNPSINYNGICVGSFDDRDTVSTSDDVMSSFSSYRDPLSTHGDREKPEVVAPGSGITTLSNSSPWLSYSWNGTSFSAPVVAGTAALMIQRSPSLAYWPESVKAILMATARTNIEGAQRLSELDGAGGIRSDLADDVARGVNGSWGGIDYDCSRPTDLTLSTVYLRAGTHARIAIAWDNDSNYGSYSSQPCADLDLVIVSPSGANVAVSTSWDNTYEIVDFVPSATGYYRVRVNKFRCSASPRYLGYAWYQTP